jgi:hypothetical protein
VAVGIFLAASAAALAQDRLGDAERLGSETEFKDFGPTARNTMTDLLRGQRPMEMDSMRLVDLASKYFVWKVTWPEVQSNRDKLKEIHHLFDLEINVAVTNITKNKAARTAFGEKLVAAFKRVFELPFEKNRMSSVNAAVMLPQMARLKLDVVADFLVSLIVDPEKHDAIKLYALRGLPEIFPAQELTIAHARNKDVLARKALDVKRIDTLVAFIERKWNKAKEDQEAFRYIRGEAIKTLGQAMVPVVEADPKTQKIDGPVVYELLRVLSSKPVLDPPPSFEEKLEAAIALCQLKIDPRADYHPDVAIHRVGRFVIDFVKEYQKDFNQFTGAKTKTRKAPLIPWKVQSERLQYALKKLVENVSENNPNLVEANKKAVTLEKSSRDLATIRSYIAERSAGRIDAVDPLLIQAVSLAQPKTQAIYSTIKKEPPIGD